MTDSKFMYSKNIHEIKPLILNLTLSKDKNTGQKYGELRKKFLIKENENDEFWKEFFAASLNGTSIKAEVLIEFRNRDFSALKIKQWGLLKDGIKINI